MTANEREENLFRHTRGVDETKTKATKAKNGNGAILKPDGILKSEFIMPSLAMTSKQHRA